MKNDIIDELKNVLANSYALYLKTQNYHWNVEGPHFKSLHELFEEQYTDLAKAIDVIAETIRMLGSKVPGSFSIYENIKKIEDANENTDYRTMISDLEKDQLIIIDSITKCLNIAKKYNNELVSSLLSDRIKIHSKNKWILRSMLK